MINHAFRAPVSVEVECLTVMETDRVITIFLTTDTTVDHVAIDADQDNNAALVYALEDVI